MIFPFIFVLNVFYYTVSSCCFWNDVCYSTTATSSNRQVSLWQEYRIMWARTVIFTMWRIGNVIQYGLHHLIFQLWRNPSNMPSSFWTQMFLHFYPSCSQPLDHHLCIFEWHHVYETDPIGIYSFFLTGISAFYKCSNVSSSSCFKKHEKNEHASSLI